MLDLTLKKQNKNNKLVFNQTERWNGTHAFGSGPSWRVNSFLFWIYCLDFCSSSLTITNNLAESNYTLQC